MDFNNDIILKDKNFYKIDDFPKDNQQLTNEDINDTLEYMLSIHSTRMRSRRRLHIRGKEDVIVIDQNIIEKMNKNEKDLKEENKTSKLIKDIREKNRISLHSVSFSGGGYNCAYHLGIIKYIFENPELFKDTKYLGTSGGAGIVGIILCYETNPNRLEILSKIIKYMINMKNLNLKFHEQVDKYTSMLETFITEDYFNKYIKDTKRCYISVTDISGYIPKNDIISNFKDYQHYLGTIRASACIPIILDNKIRKIENKKYLDGGLSNNLPILNDKTIRISCLNYPFLQAEIYPKIISDIRCSFSPPTENYILNMCDLGFSNIEEYMKNKKNKLDDIKRENKIDKCISNFINDPENDF